MEDAHKINQYWSKSSYSNAGGSCVETRTIPGFMLVRDSKDRRPDQPIIKFSQATWLACVQTLKTPAL